MLRFSKKLLSVLICALLVFSSMPYIALADDSLTNLENAIAAYESKMDGTIYTNMTAAYEAYVDANKALDAYKYGGVSLNINSYANNLNAKTQAMTQWQQQYAKKFINIISTGNQAFPDDSTDSSDLARYEEYGCRNVLAWKRADESIGSKISCGKIGRTEIEFWCYPNVVLLVDDSGNVPQFPILAMAAKNAYNSTRWIWQLYPSKSLEDNSNNDEFRLADNWHASTTYYWSNRNYNWTWTMGLEMGNAVQEQDNGEGNMGFAMGEAGAVSQTYRTRLYHDGRWISMANVVKYIGSFDGYYKTYDSIPFYRNSGDNAGDEVGFANAAYPIHIVKYEPLLKTMKETKRGLLRVAEDSYTQGGLKDVLEAYDKATAIDPVNVNYADDISKVQTVGLAIENADNALKSAVAIADTRGYSNLRRAILSKKSIYEAGSEGYKPVSWTDFSAAYEAAEQLFADIQITGYNSTEDETATSEYAQQLADYLNSVELIPLYDKVDTNELEMLIDEAEDAASNKEMFTPQSYLSSDIEALMSSVKTEIWGEENNYPNPKYKLNLSDENTALVEADCIALRDSIYTLKIDKTTLVASADNNSMQSAIELSNGYASEDYGNYAELASAVAAANGYVVTVNNITKGCIIDKVSDYKEKVRAIIYSINMLRPAFDKITNGTFGSMTKNMSTMVRSTGDASGGPRWTLNFVRNNNVVVFRTEYAPFTVDLGGATLEWYSKDNDYDAHLDSVNVYDVSEDNKIGELVTSWATTPFNPGNVSIESEADKYPGMLSTNTEENSQYLLKNLTVSSSSASKLGCDLDGRAINDSSVIFDEYLSSTQGASSDRLEGTVVTNRGTAYIDAEFTISVPREQKKVISAKTLPKITEHTVSSNLGMVYFWKYTKNTIRWQGYSHDRVPYSQTTYVMNIAPLIELINMCREYEDKERIYQITPWNNFVTALSAARADMDYGNMNAQDIESACQTRYTNLWNAYTELLTSKAANNISIHEAVEGDENVGNVYKADNRDKRWSETRWNAFKDAYLEAASAIEQGGKYSDYNVRNYNEDEQSAIDEIAGVLNSAYENLIKYGKKADFTPVYNAAKDITLDEQGNEIHTLQNDLYTAESLEALSEKLSDASKFPYLNMSGEEKAVTYAEPEVSQAIAEEAIAISNEFETTLREKEAGVDESALEAAKAYAKAQIKNPDAFSNIEEVKELIEQASNTQTVIIFDDYALQGVKYATQEELNEAVSALLEELNVKQYEVKVVDADGNAVNAVFKDEEGNEIESVDGKLSLDYGTKVVVYAPGEENVDWFYSYKSNTVSRTQSKYYTTDKWIHLTVRGDTTLVIKSAAAQTETVKVTYVNAQTGKTFAVDYTAKDAEYTLEEAPTLPYYTFAGYALEADSDEYVSSITPSEDVIVYAVYEFDETKDYFTVTLANVNGSITTTQYLVEDFEYNDLVEFTVGDGSYNTENSGIYQSSKKNGQYKVNGETSNLPGTNKNPIKYTSSEIYAWAVVKADDMDDWDEYRDTAAQADYLQNVEQVVMYGDSYSFRVCEDVYVIPYSEDEFNEAVEAGLIEGVSATEKAAVYAKDKILDETGGQKISMIGNFTLPEGCELVEAGMLFKATTNGTIPTADLTLANAGTNGIARMKSSSHTAGNQFVISVNTKKFIGTNTTISVIFKGYMIYTDGVNQFVVYSNTVTDSVLL